MDHASDQTLSDPLQTVLLKTFQTIEKNLRLSHTFQNTLSARCLNLVLHDFLSVYVHQYIFHRISIVFWCMGIRYDLIPSYLLDGILTLHLDLEKQSLLFPRNRKSRSIVNGHAVVSNVS